MFHFCFVNTIQLILFEVNVNISGASAYNDGVLSVFQLGADE